MIGKVEASLGRQLFQDGLAGDSFNSATFFCTDLGDLTQDDLLILIYDKSDLGGFWGYIPKQIVKRIYMGKLDSYMRQFKQILER